MGFFNRRNAFLGWLAWSVGKRVIRRKARAAVPSIDTDAKRPNKPAVLLAALAAVGGALLFWRSRGGDDDGMPPTE